MLSDCNSFTRDELLWTFTEHFALCWQVSNEVVNNPNNHCSAKVVLHIATDQCHFCGFRVKELGPDCNKKGGEDYIAFDDTPDLVSPTLSNGDSAGNNADLALLCTHSVSTDFDVLFIPTRRL